LRLPSAFARWGPESAERVAEPPDYRYFEVRGSHDHLGYELGRADPPFQMQFWWWPPPAPAFAEACRDVVYDLHPHLIDEFEAYADAQRLPARELWRRCCRVHLKARVRPAHLLPTSTAEGEVGEIAEGCSTFVWFSPSPRPASPSLRREEMPSTPGRRRCVVVGRNYDYLPHQTRRQRIRFAPDCCANASVGARGGVPCGRYDGVNQHGLFVSLHVVMTDTPAEDEVRPGVPFHLVARMALERCHTAREAAGLLERIPHLSSLNYLVADQHDAFVIEADPRRVRVLEREGDTMVATNHFRHPEMHPLQGGRTFENSACRLAFLMRSSASQRLHAPAVDDLLRHAGHIMADRTAPVCGLSGSLTTLWSCVAELTTRRIRYASGPPSHTPYEELPAP
jgi:hypothetical protein